MKMSRSRAALSAALVLALYPAARARLASSDRTPPRQEPTSIIVKLKPSLAAEAEASLRGGAPNVKREASARIQAFVDRYGVRALSPVHDALVRSRLETGTTDADVARATQRRFAARARRRPRGLQPPEVSRTYVLLPSGSSSEERQALIA